MKKLVNDLLELLKNYDYYEYLDTIENDENAIDYINYLLKNPSELVDVLTEIMESDDTESIENCISIMIELINFFDAKNKYYIGDLLSKMIEKYIKKSA